MTPLLTLLYVGDPSIICVLALLYILWKFVLKDVLFGLFTIVGTILMPIWAVLVWIWHRGFLDDWDEWSDTHRQSFAVFYFCHRKFVMPEIEKEKPTPPSTGKRHYYTHHGSKVYFDDDSN